jgi:simple sugar transport system permease protein
MALTACGLAWWLLARTLTGFRLRVVGLAPQAAAYAGFSTNAVVWLCLLGSGGLAGLAGSLAVLGPAPPAMGHGIGYAAIVVALLGRLHPVGVVAAGLLVADLSMGGTHIAIGRGLTLADTGVMPGLLLVCLLGCDALARSGRVAKGR